MMFHWYGDGDPTSFNNQKVIQDQMDQISTHFLTLQSPRQIPEPTFGQWFQLQTPSDSHGELLKVLRSNRFGKALP